jgi:hypothetical protein
LTTLADIAASVGALDKSDCIIPLKI